EFKIRPLQPVSAQNLLHHLRHGLVLKYGALPGVAALFARLPGLPLRGGGFSIHRHQHIPG
ncbi:TPA: hypothetical protein ACOEMG_000669, partial [Enterobacter hormaechei subsp. xiangfangensis]